MAKSDGGDYFRRSDLSWIALISLSFGYFTLTVFAPELIPYESLGSFGSFTKHLVDNHAGFLFKGWLAAWIVHVFEAIIALRVCSDKGITNTVTRCLWFLQTFLFGYASLGLLLKYKPDRPKQN